MKTDHYDTHGSQSVSLPQEWAGCNRDMNNFVPGGTIHGICIHDGSKTIINAIMLGYN